MTAMNLIVQASAGSAYLLTDTAAYAPDGRILEFCSKVTALTIGGKACAAITTAGGGFYRPFGWYLRRLRVRSVDDLTSVLPDLFRKVDEFIRPDVEAGRTNGDMSIALAVYDHVAGQPKGFVMSNRPMAFPVDVRSPPYRPFTLQPTRLNITGLAYDPFPGKDLCDRRAWRPELDADRLIAAQRVDPFSGGRTCIGGQAILTRVGHDGIDQSVVTTWDDRRGKPIDLERPRPDDALSRARRWLRAKHPPTMPHYRLRLPIIRT